jgi:hypothetical protein
VAERNSAVTVRVVWAWVVPMAVLTTTVWVPDAGRNGHGHLVAAQGVRGRGGEQYGFTEQRQVQLATAGEPTPAGDCRGARFNGRGADVRRGTGALDGALLH